MVKVLDEEVLVADLATATELAAVEPVIVRNGPELKWVLLTCDEFQPLGGGEPSMFDLIGKNGPEPDFDPPRLQDKAPGPVDFD